MKPPRLRTFNAKEIARITAEAQRRIDNHPNTWSVDPHRFRNEAIGIAAEWAVAGWLDLPDDRIWEDHGAHGDGGTDLVLHDGRIAEVKATVYANGHLLVPQYDKGTADLYILCTKDSNHSLRAAGFATREHFAAMHTLRDFGHGQVPALPQHQLQHFALLEHNILRPGPKGEKALGATTHTPKPKSRGPQGDEL